MKERVVRWKIVFFFSVGLLMMMGTIPSYGSINNYGRGETIAIMRCLGCQWLNGSECSRRCKCHSIGSYGNVEDRVKGV